MASVVIDVTKALGEVLAKKVWDDLNGNDYGDATKSTRAILAAIDQAKTVIIDTLTNVVTNLEYSQNCTRIRTWTEQLAIRMQAKKDGEAKADAQLVDIENDLKSTSNGIIAVLDRMHDLLVQASKYENRGLIDLACRKLDEDLKNPGQVHRDMCWYMLQMDRFLAAQIYMQMAGLALRLYLARGDAPASSRAQAEWRKKIDAQIETAFRSFHPLIRVFKWSYFEEIPRHRFYRFLNVHSNQYMSKGGSSVKVECNGGQHDANHPALHWCLFPPIDRRGTWGDSGAWAEFRTPSEPKCHLYGNLVYHGSTTGAGYSKWEFEMHGWLENPWSKAEVKIYPVADNSEVFRFAPKDQFYGRFGCPFEGEFRAEFVRQGQEFDVII